MNCEQSETLLAAYVFGEVKPPMLDELRKHLDGCGFCAAKVHDMKAASALVEQALKASEEPALSAERQTALTRLNWARPRGWEWLRERVGRLREQAGRLKERMRAPVRSGRIAWSPIATAACILLGLVILAGMLLPATGRARDEARKVRSASNLTQIAKSANLWMNKKGDQAEYPESLERLADDGIVKEPKVFLNPREGTQAKPGQFTSDYDSVFDQAGRKLKESELSSDTPLAWEKRPSGEGRSVVFADSHAEFVPEKRFQELMKKVETVTGKPVSGGTEIASAPTKSSRGLFGGLWAPKEAAPEPAAAPPAGRFDREHKSGMYHEKDGEGGGGGGGAAGGAAPDTSPSPKGGLSSKSGSYSDGNLRIGAGDSVRGKEGAFKYGAPNAPTGTGSSTVGQVQNAQTRGGQAQTILDNSGSTSMTYANTGRQDGDKQTTESIWNSLALNTRNDGRSQQQNDTVQQKWWFERDDVAKSGRTTTEGRDGGRPGRGPAGVGQRGESGVHDELSLDDARMSKDRALDVATGLGRSDKGTGVSGVNTDLRKGGTATLDFGEEKADGTRQTQTPGGPRGWKEDLKPGEQRGSDGPSVTPIGGKDAGEYGRVKTQIFDNNGVGNPDLDPRAARVATSKNESGKGDEWKQNEKLPANDMPRLISPGQPGGGTTPGTTPAPTVVTTGVTGSSAGSTAGKLGTDKLDRVIEKLREQLGDGKTDEETKMAAGGPTAAESLPMAESTPSDATPPGRVTGNREFRDLEKRLEELARLKAQGRTEPQTKLSGDAARTTDEQTGTKGPTGPGPATDPTKTTGGDAGGEPGHRVTEAEGTIGKLNDEVRTLKPTPPEATRDLKDRDDDIDRYRNVLVQQLKTVDKKHADVIATVTASDSDASKLGPTGREKDKGGLDGYEKRTPDDLTVERAPVAPEKPKPATQAPEPARVEQQRPEEQVRFNDWTMTHDDYFSTFAATATNGSYMLTRAAVRRNVLPAQNAVRVEEYVNNFDYNYSASRRNAFGIHTTLARSPFRTDVYMLQVGVKARLAGRDGCRPNNLVFCVDTSGSMGAPDRLPLAQKAMKMLVANLAPVDRVSIVAFNTNAGLVLDTATVDKDRKAVLDCIDSLQTTGSTNLANGLAVAYAQAHRSFLSGGNNSVVVLTDGVANVGSNVAKEILAAVQNDRKQGITLTCAGVGGGEYNDALLEQLANNGDGQYLFIDTADEAKRVFVDEFARLEIVAKDAKIQVEFDTDAVRRYRLLGYETRDIADQDFRNDDVNAGAIGSGQTATALYELELVKAKGPVATVRVRYRDVDTGKVEEISSRVNAESLVRVNARTPARFRLAACAAQFAELLRGSPYAKNGSLKEIENAMNDVCAELPLDGKAAELLQLVREAQGLVRQSP